MDHPLSRWDLTLVALLADQSLTRTQASQARLVEKLGCVRIYLHLRFWSDSRDSLVMGASFYVPRGEGGLQWLPTLQVFLRVGRSVVDC